MRLSSFGLYILLIGTCAATPTKNFNNVKRQAPGPPPPPLPSTGWTPEKPKPKPLVDHPKAKVLYRGEYFRGPEDVKKANGFDSHAKRIFEGKHPDYGNGMNAELFKKGSSLYEHAVFKNPVSSYVPTSRDVEEALKFAKSADKTGYLYKIRSYPDMVDVVGSLGGEDYFKHFKEQEVAGVYDIPWHRVESWQEVKRSAQTGEYEIGKEMPNEDFVELPIGEPAYLTHRELAGWPEGSVASEHEAWAPYRNVPVEGMLNEHLLRHRHNNNVEEFKKWRGSEKWAILPCSGSRGLRKRAGGTDACALISEEPVKVPNREGISAVDSVNSAEETQLTPYTEEELMRVSDEFAEKEFGRLAAMFRLGEVITRLNNRVSFAKLRASLKGYKPLTPTKLTTQLRKMGGIALTSAGLGIWVKDMVDVFSQDSTASEQAVVATSIVPLVGCSVLARVNAEQETPNAADSTLCFISDALMVTPAWPVGLVVQAIRLIVGSIPAIIETMRMDDELRELRDPNILKQRFNDGWMAYEAKLQEQFKSKAFIHNLKSQYTSDQLANIFDASRVAGGLRAGTLQAATSLEERRQLENNTRFTGEEELWRKLCENITQRKHQLTKDITSQAALAVLRATGEYDGEFFRKYKQQAIKNAYRGLAPSWSAEQGIVDDVEDYVKSVRGTIIIRPSRAEVKTIRKHIEALETPAFCKS